MEELPKADSGRDVPAESAHRASRTILALGGINRRTRDIYLAYRAGYTYDEIAAHCGVSRRAIKRAIARALLAIMEC